MPPKSLSQEVCINFSPKKAALLSPPPSPFLPDPKGAPIVVSKFSGWGSLLNLFPLLSGLRSRYPNSPITFLTDRRNEDLAHRLPFFDQILYLPTSRQTPRIPIEDLLKTCLSLRSLSPALYLDLQLHSRKRLTSFLSWASGAKTRVGFIDSRDRTRIRSLTHALYFNNHQPIRGAVAQISSLLDLPSLSSLSTVLYGNLKDEEALHTLLPEARSSHATLCTLNPNASEMAYERRWPIERFRDVCLHLLENDPTRVIVLTGTKEERPYVEKVTKDLSPRIAGRIRNLAGQLSFGGLGFLLKRSDLFISNDSGPLHLALHLNTPTIGLFGPTHPDLISFFEPSHKTVFLYTPLYCSPCVHQAFSPPCGGNNLCMEAITVDSVIRASESILDRKHRPIPHLTQTFLSTLPVQEDLTENYPVALYRTKTSCSSDQRHLRDNPVAPSITQNCSNALHSVDA